MESTPGGDSGSLELFTSSGFTVNTQITMQIPVLWGSNSNYRSTVINPAHQNFFQTSQKDYASHSLPKWQVEKLTPSFHFGIYRYPLDKSLSGVYIVQLVSPTRRLRWIVIYPMDSAIQIFNNQSLKFKVDCSTSTPLPLLT